MQNGLNATDPELGHFWGPRRFQRPEQAPLGEPFWDATGRKRQSGRPNVGVTHQVSGRLSHYPPRVPSSANRPEVGPGPVFWIVLGALFTVNAVVQWLISDNVVVKMLSTVAPVCYFLAAALVWRRARTPH